MIPFARMINFGNVVRNTNIIDLDFRNAMLGTSDVLDVSDHHYPFTKINSTGTNVIQFDSTLNTNVMYFNGALYSTPMVSDLYLSSKDFEIEFVYKSLAGGVSVLFGTGYYPDTANRISGICYQMHQNSDAPQTFVTGTIETSYWRNQMSGVGDNTWYRVVITRTGTTVSVSCYNMAGALIASRSDGSGQTFGNGTSFGIGGYYKTLTSNLFYGYVQYLKIKEL